MKSWLTLRMLAPIAATSLLLLAVGGGSAWYVHRLQKSISNLLAINLASVRAAEELEIGISQVRSHLKDYRYTGDRQHLARVEELRPSLNSWVAEAERLATTPREQQLMSELRRGYDRFFTDFERVARSDPKAGVPIKTVGEMVEESLGRDVIQPAHEYLDLNEKMADDSSRQNQELADRLVLALLVLGTCGAVAGLIAGFGIARGIRQSIVQLNIPIRDATGKLNEVVGPLTFSAGADFKELEAALQELAGQTSLVVKRLQASEREVLRAEQLAAVGQMAAGLAHELRNPLMAMKVLVQPGADGDDVSLTGRDLSVLNEEIMRLDCSIQEFLDFARPPQLEKRPFDLGTMLEQTLQLVGPRADSQGVRLLWQRPAQPVPLEADMGQVRQVLLNLLLNALDALPSGGTVQVQVATNGPAGAPWLSLQVSDTGPGLPQGLGPRIFDPFVSTKETGLGLGLSICKRIVEAHGGDITAGDRPQGGAVFTVALPQLAKKDS